MILFQHNILKTMVFFLILFSSELSAMQTKKTGFPKWDGLIYLQEAGLPTPNGAFVKPHSTGTEIEEIVNTFGVKSKTALIALRPDGLNGFGKTPPGINFPKTNTNEIIKKLIEWSSIGYGVTLVETHNRFDYDFCCNVLLLNEDGDFVVEFVGPGFDGGDLNKQILKPTVIVRNKDFSPIFMYSDSISGQANIESLNSFWLRVDIARRLPTDEEVNTRLEYITQKLLPDAGINIVKSVNATKEWLRSNGCDRLLQPKAQESFLLKNDLEYIILSASLYAHHLLSLGQKITGKALTAHKYNGSVVFFGTYDGHKWGK